MLFIQVQVLVLSSTGPVQMHILHIQLNYTGLVRIKGIAGSYIFTSPYYRKELHNSFQKNKYTTYVCSTNSNNHDEFFGSYGELYGSCEEDTNQNFTSLAEHIEVNSSGQEKTSDTVTDEQNFTNNEQSCQDLIPADAHDIHSDAINQVLIPLTAMKMEIKRYQDILLEINDGICQRKTITVNNLSSVSKKSKRNRRTKYHKYRRSSASSENLVWLSDGGAFSTWAMDEWLVVEKV